MLPQIEVLPREKMLSTLKDEGHHVTSEFSLFQDLSANNNSLGKLRVDFIRLWRTFTIQELQEELRKELHRLSTPDEALALAICKQQGKLGNLSDEIMIVGGIANYYGVEYCLSLQLWHEHIRITKALLIHALRSGNFVLTTSLTISTPSSYSN